MNMVINGARARDEMMGEVFEDAGIAHGRIKPRKQQEALDFRGEGQGIGLAGIEQRLDPQAVPGQEELSVAAVPDGKRKHAV
jgi:hypothetical protein